VKVRSESVAQVAVVIPEGRLDFGAAADFHQRLEKTLGGAGKAPVAVIIDCASLDYVSSAGLRVLLQAARAAQRAGTSFALCALQPAVREVFEVSGFDRIIDVHADRAAALATALPDRAPQERRATAAADAARLPTLMQFLGEFWSSVALPPQEALPFELALEEVFMNVVMHGSPPGALPQVEVALALTDGTLTMTIEDDGPPFDPLSLPAPDVSLSLEERRVGGNGVFLVRQMMDAVRYQRVDGRNQLKMSKQLAR
jgi:anti-anti-sigma factor